MPSIDETVPERRMSRKMSRAMSRQMSHAAVAAEVRELQRRETDLDTRIAALRRQSTAFGAPPALSLQPSHERGVRRPGVAGPAELLTATGSTPRRAELRHQARSMRRPRLTSLSNVFKHSGEAAP